VWSLASYGELAGAPDRFTFLIAAVKAILLNLLSVGASFGALVIVFQEGHGSKLFGSRTAGTVYPIVRFSRLPSSSD